MIKINKHDRRACCQCVFAVCFYRRADPVCVGGRAFWQPGAYGAQPWRRYLCGRPLYGGPPVCGGSLPGVRAGHSCGRRSHQGRRAHGGADLCGGYVKKQGSLGQAGAGAPRGAYRIRNGGSQGSSRRHYGAGAGFWQGICRLYGWPYGAGFCSGSAKLCKSEYASLCGRGA